MSGLQSLWDNLWKDYTSFNPHAKKVYDVLLAREKTKDPSAGALINDHVAYRTFDVDGLGVDALAATFEKYGYEYKKDYHFKQKKLYAKHYEHKSDPNQPKIFISELLTNEFSPRVREIVDVVKKACDPAKIQTDEFLWSGRSWKVSYETYQALLAESEYAAWMYAFGYRPNHFTVSFNHMKSFSSLQELNEYLKSQGFSLNSAGSEIKGSPTEYLEQSSTLAGKVDVEFEDAKHSIPACYYEFARRYPLPDGKLYTGFVATSADKIFESTNAR